MLLSPKQSKIAECGAAAAAQERGHREQMSFTVLHIVTAAQPRRDDMGAR